jgi:hypothetical protein
VNRRAFKISAELSLDDSFVTKTVAILAQRRKGKTYTAAVAAEELVASKIPFVALDPTGAWWGLRASADGAGAGLPVVILGGQHGDVGLERTGGRVAAELVVDHPGFYVLDLSLFESAEAERQFATDFAERLYRRKGQTGSDFAMHLFVDEADRFAPQRPLPGDQRMLGAYEAIVRRGGLRGIGSTLISQRAAVVNKNVLEQVDIVIVLRTVGPNDRRAIDRYVEAHGTADERAALMGSLASLKLGEAWIWEPGGDPPLFERVHIRERRTFNSSATPKPGEKRIEPTRMAEVDLARVRELMAATVERAKLEDPKELRRRIVELERQLLDSRNKDPKTERVEVPYPVVPKDAAARLERIQSVLLPTIERVPELIAETKQALAMVASAVDGELMKIRSINDDARRAAPKGAGTRKGRNAGDVGPAPHRSAPIRPTPAPPSGDVTLTRPQRRILDALAWLEAIGLTPALKFQVALFAYASPTSSSYTNNLGALRTAGLIDYPAGGRVDVTDTGRAYAQPADAPASSAELQELLYQKLTQPKVRILRALVDAYPQPLTKDELAEAADASATSSSFTNNLGALRSLGVIDYPTPGLVVAQPILFLEQAVAS